MEMHPARVTREENREKAKGAILNKDKAAKTPRQKEAKEMDKVLEKDKNNEKDKLQDKMKEMDKVLGKVKKQ